MPTIELDLAPAACIRLRQYVETAALAAGAIRTDHWATFGAQNRISFMPAGSRVRLSGGAGFDDCYALNFEPPGLRGWAHQKWALWKTRKTSHRFIEAFLAGPGAGKLGLGEAGSVLGTPLTPHKPLAAYYFNLIEPHLQVNDHFQYLEIGAGSGYLAALLHHAHRCNVIIVDLPEIIPFSFIYLNKLFPQASFQLPNEIAAAAGISRTANFVFLSPDQIGLIPDGAVDLAVNTASFGEMLPQQVRAYFELLRRATSANGLFFTANRVEKWMSPTATAPDDRAPAKGVAVRFDDYPWSPDDIEIFYGASRFHDIVQPHNPFLMRLVQLARN